MNVKQNATVLIPQNAEWTKTTDMVKEIAEVCDRKILTTKLLKPCVNIAGVIPGKIGGLVNKAFGNNCYDFIVSIYEGINYRIVTWRESIVKTEKQINRQFNNRQGMFDLLEGKEQHCEFDGVETVLKEDGRYCCVPVIHKVTLGEIVDLLQEFKEQPVSLMMPKMPEGSFAKKLFSLYLSYLPADKFKYAMKMNCDNRGSFTELVHTVDCGQVSVNISKPGITKGQHWHNSKWEQFIVVHGHGLIEERNINTGEKVSFEVSGDKIEAIYMIPGWTHNIINLSETEDLVTVMTCNEVFDPGHPDTFGEPV